MRLLTVRHVTIYRYSEPVGLGEHRMMFRPRESQDLRLVKTRLDIMPKPKHLRWLHDVFDNSVAIATFSGRTSELRFESTVTLEHVETALPDYALDPAAKTYPFAYPSDDRPDLTRALQRHCPATDVDHWAASFLAPSGSTSTSALLRSMTLGIKEQFVYSRRIERDVQTPSETLQRGRGTCRDFALLLLEGVRSLCVPPRFVRGYIFLPDADRAPTVGGGATHALLQVSLPGAGWVDFDPTNSIIGNRNLIRVAVTWDPAQAVPLWGSFIGFLSFFLRVGPPASVTEDG